MEYSPVPHIQWEAGSFRDRNSRVAYGQDAQAQQQVFRVLNTTAYQEWQFLSKTQWFQTGQHSRQLLLTTELPKASWPTFDPHLAPEVAACLSQERVPFLTYPYEWSFSMLKRAALFHLEVLQQALAEDLILQDATPYNIQWLGHQPTFMDIGSFRRYQEGEPWLAQRQFCEMFLHPLMLRAYKDFAFQGLLKSNLEGIPILQLRRCFGLLDWLRPGVFAYVVCQAILSQWMERQAGAIAKTVSLPRSVLTDNWHSLHQLISQLTWQTPPSFWSRYTEHVPYSDNAQAFKLQFVTNIFQERVSKTDTVFDLGCNLGEYALLAARYANYVIAVDSDPQLVDRLFQQVCQKSIQNILPLVQDLANPSPDLGWLGQERKSFYSRMQPNLIMALAITHHMVISRHILLADWVKWLASFKTPLIIEFAAPEDPMVSALLEQATGLFPDYGVAQFEYELKRWFILEACSKIPESDRILYYGIPIESYSGAS